MITITIEENDGSKTEYKAELITKTKKRPLFSSNFIELCFNREYHYYKIFARIKTIKGAQK